MRKKMCKMMCKVASLRKMMRKTAVMRKIMRKTMRKLSFMCKMMRKMKISSLKGEHSRSEQHKTFKCHLLAQNVYCLLKNQNTSFQNRAYQV